MAGAIECFQLQTYENKRLLIVSEDETLRDVIPVDDDRISFWCGVPHGIALGKKRNASAEHAESEVIAHWDSDDHSEPGRLADQMERLLSSGKDVTGYSSMRFTDGAKWWLYRGLPNFALGTSLCYRKTWWAVHPFRAQNDGEDSAFVAAAANEHALCSVPDSGLMYARLHAGNTSRYDLTIGESWQEIEG